MTEYLVTFFNGDYEPTYRAKTIAEAFQCITEAGKNHILKQPEQLDQDELMETLVSLKNGDTPKVWNIAGYSVETVNTRAPYVPPDPAPDWLKAEQEKWRRFELTVTSKEQVDELNVVLENGNFTRRELALIVTSLQLRPGFSLDDFTEKADSGEPFATDDP